MGRTTGDTRSQDYSSLQRGTAVKPSDLCTRGTAPDTCTPIQDTEARQKPLQLDLGFRATRPSTSAISFSNLKTPTALFENTQSSICQYVGKFFHSGE